MTQWIIATWNGGEGNPRPRREVVRIISFLFDTHDQRTIAICMRKTGKLVEADLYDLELDKALFEH